MAGLGVKVTKPVVAGLGQKGLNTHTNHPDQIMGIHIAGHNPDNDIANFKLELMKIYKPIEIYNHT